DVVRTIAVNGTMAARWPRNKVIGNEKIKAGDVIVGFASYGQASYESFYNSGIGSNGLTSARHDVLHKTYGARFKESYDTSLDDDVVYIGPHFLKDELNAANYHPGTIPSDAKLTVGELLLSPTRTYAPMLKTILENNFEDVHGLIHCSGGGQTKCMKYLPDNFKIIKDNLFDVPPIFDIIQQSSHSDNREMYQVFNMGCRLEIFTEEKSAENLIALGKQFGIEAKITGRVEKSDKKELLLRLNGEEIIY
ncbi:MAG TPA: AIR synthase-related protein, partial [Chitinophagaceae bacterium]|nr:AIR synthase-related protein [Chitinophagaceae bacterium]